MSTRQTVHLQRILVCGLSKPTNKEDDTHQARLTSETSGRPNNTDQDHPPTNSISMPPLDYTNLQWLAEHDELAVSDDQQYDIPHSDINDLEEEEEDANFYEIPVSNSPFTTCQPPIPTYNPYSQETLRQMGMNLMVTVPYESVYGPTTNLNAPKYVEVPLETITNDGRKRSSQIGGVSYLPPPTQYGKQHNQPKYIPPAWSPTQPIYIPCYTDRNGAGHGRV